MHRSRPSCPHLPAADKRLDRRELSRHGDRRDGAFYLSALRYAQAQWLRGFSARSILVLTRGLYAMLRGDEAELRDWPSPYAALHWILHHHCDSAFLGNPRISFQHQAIRMRGERAGVNRWRAWACWHIVRAARSDLPGDPRDPVVEPEADAVYAALAAYGLPGEAGRWRETLARACGDPGSAFGALEVAVA